MPTPIAHWNRVRDVWETDQAGLFCEHLAVFSATLPPSGSLRSGSLFEHPTSGQHMAGRVSSLLRSPLSVEWKGTLSIDATEWRNRYGKDTANLTAQIAELHFQDLPTTPPPDPEAWQEQEDQPDP